MANDRYYIEKYTGLEEDWPEIFASVNDFASAIDLACDHIVRRGDANALNILSGDYDGPDETIARVEAVHVAENDQAHQRNADAVLTIDAPDAVPREFVELAAGNEIFEAYVGTSEMEPAAVYVQLRGDHEAVDDASRRYQMLELAPRVKRSQRDEWHEEPEDPSAKRFSIMELDDDLKVNPRRRKPRRGALTKKGERYYRARYYTETLAADAKRPFATKERGMRMREAIIESNLQRNPRANPHALYIEKIVGGKFAGYVAGPYTSVHAAVDRLLQLEMNEGRRDVEFRLHEEGQPHQNPAEIDTEDADDAVDKFKEFHRYDPRRLEEIDKLEIPRRVRKMGAAKYVLYRSSKVDPATLRRPSKAVDYIHEHDAGVTVYTTEGAADTDVPKSIYQATALVRLGKCLGFALRDGDEAKGTPPLPDLACTPDGKCLLVIQDKTKVLAMFWGGALGVFARGIDG